MSPLNSPAQRKHVLSLSKQLGRIVFIHSFRFFALLWIVQRCWLELALHGRSRQQPSPASQTRQQNSYVYVRILYREINGAGVRAWWARWRSRWRVHASCWCNGSACQGDSQTIRKPQTASSAEFRGSEIYCYSTKTHGSVSLFELDMTDHVLSVI